MRRIQDSYYGWQTIDAGCARKWRNLFEVRETIRASEVKHPSSQCMVENKIIDNIFFFSFSNALRCRNLQYASNLLESTGIIGVIEPINNYSLPGYYLNSYEKGAIQIYADYREEEKNGRATHRTEPKSINNTVHECATCAVWFFLSNAFHSRNGESPNRTVSD